EPGRVAIDAAETEYLCRAASAWLARPVTPEQVVWSYAGVRPLYDDHAKNAAAVTRDYVFHLDEQGAPVLSVFGGKITTYRRLAEHALERLGKFLPGAGGPWTDAAPLPRGDRGAAGAQLWQRGAAAARRRRRPGRSRPRLRRRLEPARGRLAQGGGVGGDCRGYPLAPRQARPAPARAGGACARGIPGALRIGLPARVARPIGIGRRVLRVFD